MGQFFFELTPDRVLDAVESGGFRVTGRCTALNSFENRVYDVELEGEETPAHPSQNRRVEPQGSRRIVKFYRPGRWSREQLLEEHEFLADLEHAEIPAIAPLAFPDGETLKQTPVGGIWYALFPKVGGRAPDELSPEQLRWIGRLLGRIHAVGASKPARNRVLLSPTTYGRENLAFLLKGNLISLEFRSRYQAAVEKICKLVEPWFNETTVQRLHGDCHLGNLLWNQQGPFFLDFDDMVRGPAVQDLWLLLPGRDQEAQKQLENRSTRESCRCRSDD